ncbi:hypothetical protein MPTK2_8g05240 [Marchantia polymorpha subsp. ruderalis]
MVIEGTVQFYYLSDSVDRVHDFEENVWKQASVCGLASQTVDHMSSQRKNGNYGMLS